MSLSRLASGQEADILCSTKKRTSCHYNLFIHAQLCLNPAFSEAWEHIVECGVISNTTNWVQHEPLTRDCVVTIPCAFDLVVTPCACFVKPVFR